MKRCETHFLSDIEIWITPKIKPTPIAVISLELPTLQHQSLQQLTQFNLQTQYLRRIYPEVGLHISFFVHPISNEQIRPVISKAFVYYQQ
jgi:hypothetical protein